MDSVKVTILVDNYTFIDQYYLGEPGLSFLVETEGKSYLLDTGYSDILIANAAAMGLDLGQIDGIVLSHGHNDHTRGLRALMKFYADKHRNPFLLAHPQAFLRRREGGLEIGMPISVQELKQQFLIQSVARPVWLTSRLVYLGEIEPCLDFEEKEAMGKIQDAAGVWRPDYVKDDSALVYCADQGLVILTGCSHSGICNIIEQAKKVCNESRIAAIVGGFHLLKAEKRYLQQTISYLSKQDIKAVYPCHCTDLAAKMEMAKELPIYEAGVGLSLTWQAGQG